MFEDGYVPLPAHARDLQTGLSHKNKGEGALDKDRPRVLVGVLHTQRELIQNEQKVDCHRARQAHFELPLLVQKSLRKIYSLLELIFLQVELLRLKTHWNYKILLNLFH